MGVSAPRLRQRRVLVGGVLRDTRVAQDLTQVDVARRLGRAQSYVSKYESGELRVDLVALVEICAALDVHVVAVVERVAAALGKPAAPTAAPSQLSTRRPQVPPPGAHRPHIVDFACFESAADVEVDGGQHQAQAQTDARGVSAIRL